VTATILAIDPGRDGAIACARGREVLAAVLLDDGPISAFEVAMVLGCSEADARAAMQRARGES
jgi:predicted ArsR family transcriptional regulator